MHLGLDMYIGPWGQPSANCAAAASGRPGDGESLTANRDLEVQELAPSNGEYPTACKVPLGTGKSHMIPCYWRDAPADSAALGPNDQRPPASKKDKSASFPYGVKTQ